MFERYVAGFRVDKNEKHVLLMEKNRPIWQCGKLNGIGGHIENELPEQAMVREFFEEAGIQTKESDWELCVIVEVKGYAVVYYYISRGDLNFVNKTSEAINVYDIYDLPDNTLFDVRWLLLMCLDKCIIHKPVNIVFRTHTD